VYTLVIIAFTAGITTVTPQGITNTTTVESIAAIPKKEWCEAARDALPKEGDVHTGTKFKIIAVCIQMK
jgi:hypothetical protein